MNFNQAQARMHENRSASNPRKHSLVDAHIHLADAAYQYHVAQIKRYLECNNIVVFAVSEDLESSKRTINLTRSSGKIFAFAGIHPVSCAKEDLDRFVRFIEESRNEVSGIGEIGLDKKPDREGADYGVQRRFFLKQLELAEKYRKPVSVHTRGSQEDVLSTLPSYNIPGILLHWFSGSETQMSNAVSRGYYVSFGPTVVYSKKSMKLASVADPNLLLVETDGPVRYGAIFSGILTAPHLIPSILLSVATILKIGFWEAADLIARNSSAYIGSEL